MPNLPNVAISIDQTIDALERRRLDTAAPPEPKVWGALDGSTVFRVVAQARFWDAAQEAGRLARRPRGRGLRANPQIVPARSIAIGDYTQVLKSASRRRSARTRIESENLNAIRY